MLRAPWVDGKLVYPKSILALFPVQMGSRLVVIGDLMKFVSRLFGDKSNGTVPSKQRWRKSGRGLPICTTWLCGNAVCWLLMFAG